MANDESFGGSPASGEQLFEEEGPPAEPAAIPRINVRLVYDPPCPQDGQRVLVDRLWPRGLAKTRAHLDVWLRDVAPSDELRRWHSHEPAKWHDFARRYRTELTEPDRQAALAELMRRASSGPLTLLCAAHDATPSNAEVVRAVLLEYLRRSHRHGCQQE